MRLFVARLALALAVVSAGWGIGIWAGGGTDVTIGSVRVTSNDPLRPLAVAIGFALLAIAVVGRAQAARSVSQLVASMTPSRFVVALALATTTLGLLVGSWTASGADSFAYVSQATLFADGQLDRAVPLATRAPWPNAVRTLTPFGYRPAPDGVPALVPVTAPGLPLVMAALQRIAGHCAAFVVTPVAAGVLILLTFAIGRDIRSPAAGAWAAWLVATSPAWLFMLMWPMSDIPAATATALMMWLALRTSASATLGAGLAGATALLLRGNLVVVVGAVGFWLLTRTWMSGGSVMQRLKRPALFSLGVLPGVLVTMWLNARWYGSPFSSGYGAAGDLLAVDRFATNAGHYLTWLTESSPIAWAGLAALLLPWATRLWPRDTARGAAWLLALVTAAVAGVYLLYQPFTDWWYLRFLLPAWPAIFIATAMWWDALKDRSRIGRAVAATVLIAAGLEGLIVARDRGVFSLGVTEGRYAIVAKLVDLVAHPDTVVLTVHHAGTLWYYAGRETVRWDELDPAALDQAIAWLEAEGRHPLIVVDDWELPMFEARFAGTRHGVLSYSPRAAWQSDRVTGWFWIYDPINRAAGTFQPGPDLENGAPWCAAPARGALRGQALLER